MDPQQAAIMQLLQQMQGRVSQDQAGLAAAPTGETQFSRPPEPSAQPQGESIEEYIARLLVSKTQGMPAR